MIEMQRLKMQRNAQYMKEVFEIKSVCRRTHIVHAFQANLSENHNMWLLLCRHLTDFSGETATQFISLMSVKLFSNVCLQSY